MRKKIPFAVTEQIIEPIEVSFDEQEEQEVIYDTLNNSQDLPETLQED